MADGNDNGIQLTYKGPIEHLDNLIPMLNPQQAQAAAGGLPAMPSAPPPPAAAPPALGRTTLGMVQPMPAVEMGAPSMPGGPAPRTLLGKVGHGLGIAGEIAGTAFAPRLMPWVPGTEQYKMREEALGQQRQDEEAERALTGAKTELTEAQAKETGEPTEKPATEDWFPVSGTNLEIERHSGNTRPIEGMQQPQPKALPDRAQWVEDENGKVAYLPESVISTEPGKYKPYKALGNMTPLQLFLTDPVKFKEYMAAMKGNAAGSKYAMVRLLGEVANYFPGLAPLIPQALEQAGIDLPPDMRNMDFLAGQPRSAATGQRIGLRMPEAPTGTVRTRGQMAQDVLQRIPSIEPLIDKLDKEGKLGPGAGRVNDLITGKVGAGDPDFKLLADQLETTASAFSRLHLNTEKGLEPFFQMLNSGKLTAANLRQGLKTIEDWSKTYARTGTGNQTGATPGNVTGTGGNVISWKDLK